MRPAVFDATALVALLRGHKKVYEIWTDAAQAGSIVVIPSTAVLLANRAIGLTDSSWEAVLEDEIGAVLALTASNALAASHCDGDIAAAHATAEAVATDGMIVTSAPTEYPGQRLFAFN